MKARVVVAKPLVLCYGLGEEKQERLGRLFERFNVLTRGIHADEVCQQVGFLAGWNGFSKNNDDVSEILSKECVVFCNIDGKTLDRIVAQMRQNDLSVDLKAVVTRFNQSWRFCDLVLELEKEHLQLH